MSRDLSIRYHGREFFMPLSKVDSLLAPFRDNATFGNLKEMYANDCYLRRFCLSSSMRVVLDLGSNRGLFSLIALRVLAADVVVSVEPESVYAAITRLLLSANGFPPDRLIRYAKCIGSSAQERRDPCKYISINCIRFMTESCQDSTWLR